MSAVEESMGFFVFDNAFTLDEVLGPTRNVIARSPESSECLSASRKRQLTSQY
jgi:hypothetical protein